MKHKIKFALEKPVPDVIILGAIDTLMKDIVNLDSLVDKTYLPSVENLRLDMIRLEELKKDHEGDPYFDEVYGRIKSNFKKVYGNIGFVSSCN